MMNAQFENQSLSFWKTCYSYKHLKKECYAPPPTFFHLTAWNSNGENESKNSLEREGRQEIRQGKGIKMGEMMGIVPYGSYGKVD